MAKKLNAKQKREAQQAEKKKALLKITAASAKAEESKKEKSVKEPGVPVRIKEKKSTAKAAGLKSAFILNPGEILMTSFGHGNEAIPEKRIIKKEVESLQDTPAFEATPIVAGYRLSGRAVGQADDPNCKNSERASKRGDKLPKEPGMDMLGLKDALEKRFFGAEVPFADNIHIQLIYNILDIEKLLAPHINNIAYVVNNLLRMDGNSDLVGNLGLGYTFSDYQPVGENLFEKLMKGHQRAYLGDALYRGDLKKGEKETKDDFRRYYYSLALLGEARQMLFHGDEGGQTAIFTFGEKYDEGSKCPQARKEARETLDEVYENRVNDLNRGFVSLAKNDLAVLFKVYGADTKEKKAELVKQYYDFIVRKEQKNMGFSLKKLREVILATEEGESIAARCEQSMRSKFTKNFDFASSVFYRNNPARSTAIVEALRASLTEEEKEAIYVKEAAELWDGIREVVVGHILPVVDPDVFKDLKQDRDVDRDMLSEVAISNKADYFSKFIYLMTRFMDGKEINDLLTQLISKFESIGAFYDILRTEDLDRTFTEGYEIFSDSWKIAGELRLIKSFARMQEPDAAAKKIMFIEAAQVLGFPGTEEELDDYVEFFLTKDNETATGIRKKLWGLTLPNKGFRNFIANNVIESSRFKYLVRYADPRKVRAIADNDQILKLVLGEIPDTQIEKYYLSCVEDTPASQDVMRDQLRRLIKKLSFTDFAEVNQAANAEQNRDKQQKQNVIRLYLTVLYLAVKNLVRVNSRYTLAFHCFERDFQLFTGSKWNRGKYRRFNELTQKFIEEKRLNRRSREYLSVNISNSNVWCIREFRNSVAHLNTVSSIDRLTRDLKKTDSYFALYHYMMQKYLLEKYEQDPEEADKEESAIAGYFETVKTYGKYRMDFVKALNTPFGYNLARYKNLSIEGLFDKDRPGEAGNGEPTED